MKRLYLLVPVIFSVLALSQMFNHAAAGGEISEAESEKILTKIQGRYQPIYEKFRGVESARQVTLREYDTRENTLVNTAQIRLVRRDYYYGKPDVTVKEYVKNDRKMKPSEYSPRRDEPPFPVFDKKGPSNYTTRVAGYRTLGGARCYRIEVMPKILSERHFIGAVYFRADTLDQVMMEGRMSKVPFGVKEYSFIFNTVMVQGVPAILSGTLTILVDVALLYPNRKFVSEIRASDIRPI